MSNIDKRATELLIENGVLVADTLRHLADNEIDSDYFAICHTNENGTEIECELAITDYARQAAGTVEELVNALEAAEKRNSELAGQLSSLFERVSGESIHAYPSDMLNWLADTIEGELDASEGALNKANAGIAELTEALKQTVSGYKSCLRTGHDRILDLGGDCDSPEVMIAGNIDIQQAEKLLATVADKGEAS